MKETNKLLVIYLLIIAIICFSCNPVKRVLADIDKVKEVRTATDDLFPCNQDSIFTTTTDTITNMDTLVQVNVQVDRDTVRIATNRDIVKTVRIRDTTFITTNDDREEKRLQGDLSLSIQRTIQAQQGEIKAKEGEEKQRKRANNLMWILIAIGAISVTGVILKLKKVF